MRERTVVNSDWEIKTFSALKFRKQKMILPSASQLMRNIHKKNTDTSWHSVELDLLSAAMNSLCHCISIRLSVRCFRSLPSKVGYRSTGHVRHRKKELVQKSV